MSSQDCAIVIDDSDDEEAPKNQSMSNHKVVNSVLTADTSSSRTGDNSRPSSSTRKLSDFERMYPDLAFIVMATDLQNAPRMRRRARSSPARRRLPHKNKNYGVKYRNNVADETLKQPLENGKDERAVDTSASCQVAARKSSRADYDADFFGGSDDDLPNPSTARKRWDPNWWRLKRKSSGNHSISQMDDAKPAAKDMTPVRVTPCEDVTKRKLNRNDGKSLSGNLFRDSNDANLSARESHLVGNSQQSLERVVIDLDNDPSLRWDNENDLPANLVYDCDDVKSFVQEHPLISQQSFTREIIDVDNAPAFCEVVDVDSVPSFCDHVSRRTVVEVDNTPSFYGGPSVESLCADNDGRMCQKVSPVTKLKSNRNQKRTAVVTPSSQKECDAISDHVTTTTPLPTKPRRRRAAFPMAVPARKRKREESQRKASSEVLYYEHINAVPVTQDTIEEPAKQSWLDDGVAEFDTPSQFIQQMVSRTPRAPSRMSSRTSSRAPTPSRASSRLKGRGQDLNHSPTKRVNRIESCSVTPATASKKSRTVQVKQSSRVRKKTRRHGKAEQNSDVDHSFQVLVEDYPDSPLRKPNKIPVETSDCQIKEGSIPSKQVKVDRQAAQLQAKEESLPVKATKQQENDANPEVCVLADPYLMHSNTQCATMLANFETEKVSAKSKFSVMERNGVDRRALQFVRCPEGGAAAVKNTLKEGVACDFDVADRVLILFDDVKDFRCLLDGGEQEGFPKLCEWLQSVKTAWRTQWNRSTDPTIVILLLLDEASNAQDDVSVDDEIEDADDALIYDAISFLSMLRGVDCTPCATRRMLWKILYRMTIAISKVQHNHVKPTT